MSVYDLAPLVFTDSYHPKFRRDFTNSILAARTAGAHFLVNAASTRHEIVCRMDIPPERVHIVPFGADGHEVGLTDTEAAVSNYFLYVSSAAQRRKNIPTVVEAFQLFLRRSGGRFLLVIVGGGTEAVLSTLRQVGMQTEGVEALENVPENQLKIFRLVPCAVSTSAYMRVLDFPFWNACGVGFR